MVSRQTIEDALRRLNAAENARPHSTVEETSAGIDKVMSPKVHGWRNGVHVPDRAGERAAEKIGFGALADYHRDLHRIVIEPPMACMDWTIQGSFNGKAVVARGSSIFRFGEDGLVEEYWMYTNPADFSYRAEYLASLKTSAPS